MAKQSGNERLAAAVHEKYGSQAEFARALGTSSTQVWRWINGRRPIRVHKEAICELLKVKPEELWP